MSNGFLHLSDHNYDRALHSFGNAIKARPGSADAYIYKAVVKAELGDFVGAECDADSALRRNDFSPLAHLIRGYSRLQIGLDSLALYDLSRVLEYDPYNQEALNLRVVGLNQLGRYPEAIQVATAVMQMQPRNADLYAMRARAHLALQDTTAAMADLYTAIQLAPMHIDAYLMQNGILVSRGQWDEVALLLDDVIGRNPYDYRLYIDRGVARFMRGDGIGALQDMDEAVNLRPDIADTYYNRALLRQNYNNLSGALQDFTTVLALQPNNNEALFNRMQLYLEAGRYNEALVDMQSIVNRYPRFYPVYYLMADVNKRLDNQQDYKNYTEIADNIVAEEALRHRLYHLGRPALSRSAVRNPECEEEDTDAISVLERYNRLVLAPTTRQMQLDFVGKVQPTPQSRTTTPDPE